MKKILAILTLAILMVSLSTHAVAVEQQILSDLSESECIEFIKQNSVEIPDDYDEATWAPFVKMVIETVEDDPYYEFQFSYTITLEFANAIKNAVNEYYGVANQNANVVADNVSTFATDYRLKDSVLHLPWTSLHGTFNCYVYALDVSLFEFRDPGAFAGKTFTLGLGISQMAEYVKKDLEALGCQRVNYNRSGFDVSNLCTNEQIICIRRGTYDYHFMKFDGGNWYHKPGKTSILRYKYSPRVVQIWTNEYVMCNKAHEGKLTYDSEIYYIRYNGHDWDYAKNYNGTHTKSCDICGDVFVKDCDLEYTYTSLNCHKSVCADCGHTVTGIACDFEYTYTGNGNSTHTHSGTCQDCGHVSTGTCSFAYSYCGTPDGTHQHISTCTVCGETKGTAVACTYLAGSSNCRICGHNKNVIVTALGLSEDTFNYVNE